jgi:hypothetical protein
VVRAELAFGDKNRVADVVIFLSAMAKVTTTKMMMTMDFLYSCHATTMIYYYFVVRGTLIVIVVGGAERVVVCGGLFVKTHGMSEPSL